MQTSRKECLTSPLSVWNQWNTLQRNTKVRDVVLLHDDDLPRNKWPLARVIKALSSKNGLVGKVELQMTRNGKRVMLERPIHKLTLLIENDEDRVESPPKKPEHQQNLSGRPLLLHIVPNLCSNSNISGSIYPRIIEHTPCDS